MPVVLLVLGFALVGTGLIMAFGQVASDRAGGGTKSLKLEGPAWLILVAIGVGVIMWGTWEFRDDGGNDNDNGPPDFVDPPGQSSEPFTYGDDSFLDDLWDSCGLGDPLSCDDLWLFSTPGSDYEWFGGTCGGLVDWAAGACTQL